MGRPPEVSVIIPCRDVNAYVRQCVRECLKLDYARFEILLLPDYQSKVRFPRTKIIATGPVKPSVKRNAAAKKTDARVLAFIDSDAYPQKDWLKNAVAVMRKKGAQILGGPNLVPSDDSVMQKAGDDILSSRVGAGGFAVRYSRMKAQEVTELPSCNLIVTKELFERIGGFDTSLLTAEDAKLCFQAIKCGQKVLYCPDVVVYHHRRPLFRPHLKQVWTYGRDKATVLHLLKGRSKSIYFMPSLFVLFIAAGFLAAFGPWPSVPLLKEMYLSLVAVYLVVVAAASLVKSPKRFLLVFPGIVLTHVSYGLGFLYGMLSRKESRKQ